MMRATPVETSHTTIFSTMRQPSKLWPQLLVSGTIPRDALCNFGSDPQAGM